MSTEAAHPESIVETEWVAQHLGDPTMRLVEVDVDLSAYVEGHIPGPNLACSLPNLPTRYLWLESRGVVTS